MFRLHDRTRRRICLIAFFLLCVVPTAVILAWCVRRHLPGHVQAEANRLGRELGLKVSLDNLSHLRPGVVRYEGLQLADPETGQTILRCRVLEAAWEANSGGLEKSESFLVLIASRAEIEAAAANRLGQLLARMLQRRTGRAEVDVRLAAADATLHEEDGSRTLTELQAGIEPFPDGTQAWISFRLPGTDTNEPVRIRITRNRLTTPPTTGLEVDTGGGAVPCKVLAIGLDHLKPLNSESRFRGYLWANQIPGAPAGDNWEGEISGQLLDVDLGSLVSERFPHQLSGMAQLAIRSARFQGGRLEEASGTLAAGPGMIGRSMVEAAVEQLHLVPQVKFNGSAKLVSYEQLALAFFLNSEGLQLQGLCPVAHPDAILADRSYCLLTAPVSQPQPTVALLRALVGDSEVQVPATRQTAWLMRYLPIPQAVDAEAPASSQARLHPGPAARQ